jgi:hypothetical protein
MYKEKTGGRKHGKSEIPTDTPNRLKLKTKEPKC